MFSGLDNFLNGNDLHLNELPDTSIQSSTNDSFDLDLSMPSENGKKSKKNGKESKKIGKKSKKDDDDDDDSDLEKGIAALVPVKGQKLAVKRLKKINDTLKNQMVMSTRIQKQEERLASKKKTSPKKQTNRGRRGRPRHIHTIDSDLSDYDSDDSDVQSTSGRSTRTAYNPNLIVLDCDDEFIGGPAVNFSRNLATASAVSVEESMDLKVSVRINSEIESFQMNKFQKLSILISKISEKKNVPSDHITLMFKGKIASEQETPDSIGYIQGLVLQAHISDMVHKNKTTASSMARSNADKLEIKIQAEGRKRPFITYIGSNDQLITLAFSCAEEFKCEVDKVLIEFDGEFINFKETAADLALEGGELMDFYMKNSNKVD